MSPTITTGTADVSQRDWDENNHNVEGDSSWFVFVASFGSWRAWWSPEIVRPWPAPSRSPAMSLRISPAPIAALQITPINEGPGVIDGPTGNTASQLASGFMIQDIRTSYDAASNTMYVGVQGYQNVAGQEAIFGDSSGNLNPSLDNNPNMTGDKAIAIQFAPTVSIAGQQVPGTPAVIAGIPADKTEGGQRYRRLHRFERHQQPGLPQYSFGQQLAQYTGTLAFNPSAAHPDVEFTIKNFSQIPGLNPANGFYIQVYAGSGQDVISGEVSSGWIKVPAIGEQQLPEPTTWMVWAALAGGAALRLRRSRRASP